MRPHRATLVLVLALLGFVFFLCAPIAWVMGEYDLRQMHDGKIDASGEALTNLGRFFGMTVTVIMLVVICAGFLFSLLGPTLL
jgi:hypothetical protein